MTMNTDGPHDLDDLFAEARAKPHAPSEALLARVLTDAMAEQPKSAPPVAVMRARRVGLWTRLAAVFGGTGALAGMGTAAAAGLFIGFVQPVDLSALGDAVLGTPLETVELIPNVGTFLDGN